MAPQVMMVQESLEFSCRRVLAGDVPKQYVLLDCCWVSPVTRAGREQDNAR